MANSANSFTNIYKYSEGGGWETTVRIPHRSIMVVSYYYALYIVSNLTISYLVMKLGELLLRRRLL